MTRFLVVDDSLLARLTVKQALEHVNGDCEIHLAANGDEALAAVSAAGPFDIVFMDLNMPGEDGFAVSAQIRRRHSDQSIVLLTANIQQKVKERAAESGLLFLAKPVSVDKIKTFLGTAEGAVANG